MSKIKGQPVIPITIEEEMTELPPEVLARIERDGEIELRKQIYEFGGIPPAPEIDCGPERYRFFAGYRAGAIAEAERAMELVEAATEAMKHMKWNGIEAKFPTYAAVNLEEALARYRAGSGGANG